MASLGISKTSIRRMDGTFQHQLDYCSKEDKEPFIYGKPSDSHLTASSSSSATSAGRPPRARGRGRGRGRDPSAPPPPPKGVTKDGVPFVVEARRLMKQGYNMSEVMDMHEDDVPFLNYLTRNYRSLQTISYDSVRPRAANFRPEVYWIYGHPGRGKSRICDEFGKKKCFGNYWRCNDNLNWADHYHGQPVVIFDDFRPDECSFTKFIKILDMYDLRLSVKGSFVLFSPKLIFITMPTHPQTTMAESKCWMREDYGQLERRITRIVNWDDPADQEFIVKHLRAHPGYDRNGEIRDRSYVTLAALDASRGFFSSSESSEDGNTPALPASLPATATAAAASSGSVSSAPALPAAVPGQSSLQSADEPELAASPGIVVSGEDPVKSFSSGDLSFGTPAPPPGVSIRRSDGGTSSGASPAPQLSGARVGIGEQKDGSEGFGSSQGDSGEPQGGSARQSGHGSQSSTRSFQLSKTPSVSAASGTSAPSRYFERSTEQPSESGEGYNSPDTPTRLTGQESRIGPARRDAARVVSSLQPRRAPVQPNKRPKSPDPRGNLVLGPGPGSRQPAPKFVVGVVPGGAALSSRPSTSLVPASNLQLPKQSDAAALPGGRRSGRSGESSEPVRESRSVSSVGSSDPARKQVQPGGDLGSEHPVRTRLPADSQLQLAPAAGQGDGTGSSGSRLGREAVNKDGASGAPDSSLQVPRCVTR